MMDPSNGPKIVKFWSYGTGESYEVTPEGEVVNTTRARATAESETSASVGSSDQPRAQEEERRAEEVAVATSQGDASLSVQSGGAIVAVATDHGHDVMMGGNNNEQQQQLLPTPGIPASAMPRIVLPPSLEEINRATPEELALISTAIDEAEMDNLLNYEIEYSYAFYWRFFNYGPIS